MSQSGILQDLTSASANIETVTGDSGGPIGPDGSYNLNLVGAESSVDNDYGITVVGAGNTQSVTLTNRVSGQISTNDADLATILTFPCGTTPGTYIIDAGNVCAYNLSDLAGGCYFFVGGVLTTGAAATELGSEFPVTFEDAAMADADIFLSISGNNILVQVLGIAGKFINWNASFTYRFVS